MPRAANRKTLTTDYTSVPADLDFPVAASASGQAGCLPISHTYLLEGVAEDSLTARVDRAPFEDVLFFLVTLLGLTARAIPIATVERGPSEAARSGSKGMLWL